MSTRLSAVPFFGLALLGLLPLACSDSTPPSPTGTSGAAGTPPAPSPTPTMTEDGRRVIMTGDEKPDPNGAPTANLPQLPPAPPMPTSDDPKDYKGLVITTLREAPEGKVLEPGMKARVHYTGTKRNGVEFDSSWRRGTEPTEFALEGFVKGFRVGLLGMRVGERRRITIPGEFAYGPGGNAGAGLGPNETIIFDVELAGVVGSDAPDPTRK